VSGEIQNPLENLKYMKSTFDFHSIRAILFDWAGTTIDYGSLAPVAVFREVFRHCGVEVTEAEAREPMGKAKLDHIRALFQMPRIKNAWKAHWGSDPVESDVLRLYATFLTLQKTTLAAHSSPIPGGPQAIETLRNMGIKIGSTTGYTRELMDVVLPLASAQGYRPDVTVCSDEVSEGRPAPWLNFKAAELLGVYPMRQVMIVDDSVAGIQAGRNAGCYSVAVSKTGNALGLSKADADQLPRSELESRLTRIEKEFIDAGADLVIESIVELPRFFANQT